MVFCECEIIGAVIMCKKIKIESRGISPWHHFLETMSWGTRPTKNDSDDMAYLNVGSKYKNGGYQEEDVLMADFLNILDFMSRNFLNEILKEATGTRIMVDRDAEIIGNAGNYYYPHEDSKNGIRLAQPDGWIADKTTLILLEAKGYCKGAKLNRGQLAKEYLIAQEEARVSGRGDNFYIMMIVPKNKYPSLFNDPLSLHFKQLDKVEGKKIRNMRNEASRSWEKVMGSIGDCETISSVAEHFIWITWESISGICRADDKCSEMIKRTIDFHRETSIMSRVEDWPIFSQFLARLEENKVPLYHFYNGGCGNGTLKEYEKKFLDAIGANSSLKADCWAKWHDLADNSKSKFAEIIKLEKKYRIAVADLNRIKKAIIAYYTTHDEYKEYLKNVKAPSSMRKAFEILGDSCRIDTGRKFFEQRDEPVK